MNPELARYTIPCAFKGCNELWKLSSSVSSNRILPFVYTFSGIFVELSIVTYVWWFQDTDNSHVVSPLKYFHLLRCSLMHATPVRNLLRHLHAAQGLVCPFAKLSSRLTAQLCDAKLCRCFHSLQRMTFEGKSACRMELRNHSLFKRLSAGTGRVERWAVFVPVSSFPL